MSDEDNIAPDAATLLSTPGGILRQAREKSGLTLGDVSGALKFSARQIEALENGDFQQLHGKTFLRGFIRAYARLLKLPPDPLLDMLAAEPLPSPEQIVVPANMGETDPLPFHRRHAKKIGVAVLALLLLGGVVWFSSENEQPTNPVATAEVALPAGAQPKPAPNASGTLEFSLATTLQSAEPAKTLAFEFSGRSWLEVKDASGQVLLTGEFPAGQKQTITGKPPYQIWIGKVSAVRLDYGGQAVDLQPHAREDVARFTLE